MTKLIQRMREELVRRNYAETTIRSYLQMIEDFRRFADKRLDHLGPDEIRKYQVHLLEGKKAGRGHGVPTSCSRTAILLREDAQAPGHERGSAVSERSAGIPAGFRRF